MTLIPTGSRENSAEMTPTKASTVSSAELLYQDLPWLHPDLQESLVNTGPKALIRPLNAVAIGLRAGANALNPFITASKNDCNAGAISVKILFSIGPAALAKSPTVLAT